MFCINSRSLVCNIDEISDFVCKEEPLVVGVTETRLTSNIKDSEIKIKNYVVVRLDSENRHTGGVACYLRSNIKYRLRDKISVHMNYWLLSLEVYLEKYKFVLICIYHSPNGNHSEFLEFLNSYMEIVCTEMNTNIIVMGDFNINWLDINNTRTKKLRNILTDIGFKQIVNDHTHFSYNSKSMIDLVFVNNNYNLMCKVLDYPIITDHLIIEVSFVTNYENSKKIRRRKLQNYNEFKVELENMFFVYRDTNKTLKYDIFYNFIDIINKYMPKYELAECKNFKPWITNNVKCIIKQRYIAFIKFKLTQTMVDWNEYKQLRNIVVSQIRCEKKLYYENNIDLCRHDSISMWKTLKSIVSDKKKECNFSEIIVNDKRLYDKGDIAENFNIYYIESIKTIVQDIPVLNNDCVTNVTLRTNSNLKCFRLISREELHSIVHGLKNKYSPDDIHTWILKEFYDVLEDKLINIINVSLETGIIPSKLKLATITPIQKIANTIKVEEYRPVNMLPVMDKILESIVYSQLISYIKENNILINNQSGFRENFSCETALQCVINDWQGAIDEDNSIIVAFLDLKRAFETIDRKILLKKLERYGITGVCLKWFENYLSQRSQQVLCDGVYSTIKSVDLGIPQGSVLGPVLFILYINDISKNFNLCHFHLFADDTIVYRIGKNIELILDQLNAELEQLDQWLKSNILKLNTDKSKVMVLGNDRNWIKFKSEKMEVKIENITLEVVTTFKYLGIIVDRKLNFEEYINYLCKKIAKKIGFLNRVGNYLSTETKKLIYNTIVLPHFTYVSTILYMCKQTDINRLQLLQNRAMRVILKCNKYTSIKSMLQKLNWYDVKTFIKFNCLVFVHKIKLGLMPTYIVEKVKYRETIYNTRRQGDFDIKKKNKTKSQNTLFYNGFREYNLLETNLKNLNVKQFKIQLRNIVETIQ